MLPSWTTLLDLTLFLVVVAMLTVIFSPVVLRPLYLPEVGDIATRDIKADRDILVEDAVTTTKRRQEAASAAVPVYDWDPGVMETVARRIGEHLKWLDESRAAAVTRMDWEKLRDVFSDRLEEVIDQQAFSALVGTKDLNGLATEIGAWLSEHAQIRVVSGPEVLNDLAHNPFVIHSMGDEEIRTSGSGATGLMDLMGMRRMLEKSGEERFSHLPSVVRKWIMDQTGVHMRPTLVLNLAETRTRRELAAAGVDPVFYRVRRGQLVIQE
ncbi:MAG: hypothetical protein HQL86_07760, partial [Magnetococcales bacterium]|nr:hypothetical protein [Magnetococcales bacterium]